ASRGQLRLQVGFDLGEVLLRLSPLFPALRLDPERLLKGGDKVVVGLPERLYFHDAPLALPGDLDASGLEEFGIPRQQVVRGVRDGLLDSEGLLLAEEADGDDYLALPQGDGRHDGALDLLHQGLVVVLDQPYLRRGLDGD